MLDQGFFWGLLQGASADFFSRILKLVVWISGELFRDFLLPGMQRLV
jgi:hypothetical protein